MSVISRITTESTTKEETLTKGFAAAALSAAAGWTPRVLDMREQYPVFTDLSAGLGSGAALGIILSTLICANFNESNRKGLKSGTFAPGITTALLGLYFGATAASGEIDHREHAEKLETLPSYSDSSPAGLDFQRLACETETVRNGTVIAEAQGQEFVIHCP